MTARGGARAGGSLRRYPWHRPRPPERRGAGDRDASASRSDVEDAAGIVEPRREARFDELCDRRSWHQHALIDIEIEPRKPRLAEDIGGGLAGTDALADEWEGARLALRDRRLIEHRVGDIEGQD